MKVQISNIMIFKFAIKVVKPLVDALNDCDIKLDCKKVQLESGYCVEVRTLKAKINVRFFAY